MVPNETENGIAAAPDKAFQMPTELTIIAIGGCGKKLVYELCGHDWFLKHYLHDNRTLKVHIFDTDANQMDADKNSTLSLNNKVEEMKREMDEPGGNVKMEFHYLPDLANTARVSDLTGSDVVDQVKQAKGYLRTEFWWLNDPAHNFRYNDDLKAIDPDIADDFGGGVHRRRAISKAVFYKAVSQGVRFPALLGQGNIAIVVGLGGGTGSGMFIDLARYIRSRSGESRKIWFFGILPTVTEGDKEQLNAAIALSELEFLNLKEKKLFHYCILSSLGPTGFGIGMDKKSEVLEYDQAFPYLLINGFYLPTADFSAIHDSRRDYSGFIFANAHVYEYSVDELMSLKSEFEKVVVKKLEDLVEIRRQIIKKVEELLSQIKEKYPDLLIPESDVMPTKDDSDYVRAEIQILKKIWGNEVPVLLKYKTPGHIDYYIQNSLPKEFSNLDEIHTYDGLIDFVSGLKKSMDGETPSAQDDDDKKLYRNITAALDQTEQLAALQKVIEQITNDELRVALKKILRGEEDLSQALGQINKKRGSFKGDKSALMAKKTEFEKKIGQLSQQKEAMRAKVIQTLASIRTRDEFLAYQKIWETFDDIRKEERNLASDLTRVHQKLKEMVIQPPLQRGRALTGEVWLTESGCYDLRANIDRISQLLPQPERLENLKEFVLDLGQYYNYKYRKQAAENTGPIQGITNAILNRTPDIGVINDLIETRVSQMKSFGDMQPKIINFHEEPLDFDLLDGFITTDLTRYSERMKKAIIDSISASLNLNLKEGDTGYGALTRILDNNEGQVIDAMEEELTGIVNAKEKYDEEIKVISTKVDDTVKESRGLSQRIEAFDRVDTLSRETSNDRRQYNRLNNELTGSLSNIDRKQKTANVTRPGLYRTRYREINPNVLSLLARIDGKSDLSALDADAGYNELDSILRHMASHYRELVDVSRLGVNNLAIPFEGSTEDWRFDKAALVISSPSHYMTDKIVNQYREGITRALFTDLSLQGMEDIHVCPHNYSKPWEVALTFFAGASFFDNISPLLGDGYWKKYAKYRNNILHHVLSLHEGKYIIRKDLLNLEEAAKIAFEETRENVENRGRAKEKIVDLYEEKKVSEAIPHRKP